MSAPPALLAAALLAGACAGAADPPPPSRAVWLDVDPAVMPGGHEPDDGVAMVQAFHSPELRVAGVSVVFGNAPVDRGYPIAREVVARFAPEDVGVYKGSAAASPDPTPASRALIAALEVEPLTVLALGPATNVAAALRERPDLADRIETAVLVIGRRAGEALTFPGGGPNLLDFNFELDPAAAEVVVGSGAPVVLTPFELAAKLPIDAEEWFSVWDTPFGEFFRRPIEDYLDWFGDNYGRRATYPFDSFAVSFLVAPELLGCDRTSVVVREGPADGYSDAGETKPWLVRTDAPEGWPVTWCHTPDPQLKEELLRRLAGRRP
ncbi:MAG: nucleoside hydrolase [Acidobacteria bacterium]|nr:nucleoside hydrolase [Acidobacteriota bacterium]